MEAGRYQENPQWNASNWTYAPQDRDQQNEVQHVEPLQHQGTAATVEENMGRLHREAPVAEPLPDRPPRLRTYRAPPKRDLLQEACSSQLLGGAAGLRTKDPRRPDGRSRCPVPQCNVPVGRLRNLTRHMKEAHWTAPKPADTSFCPDCYKTLLHIEQHKQRGGCRPLTVEFLVYALKKRAPHLLRDSSL